MSLTMQIPQTAFSYNLVAQPITFQDVLEANRRIRPFLQTTPLRHYLPLDTVVGNGIKVLVKHENHHPTNSFKVRNGLSVMTTLTKEEKKRGVVAATRGNHGQGVAWAGALLGVPVSICVPVGNNPEKNEAMRSFGAQVIEEGNDYDESIAVAEWLVSRQGLRMVHATNDPHILAGAGTMAMELFEDQPSDIDAIVVAVGGGSLAVGALTVAREFNPNVEVFGVQAEGASAMFDSWMAGHPVERKFAHTFADGLATRGIYEMTFGALLDGLSGFVTVSEAQIAEAVRVLMKTTHNLAEGAGAAGLAGLMVLGEKLAGKNVAVVLSGSNIDEKTLQRVIRHEI